jgi:hypothetical protein
MASPRHSIGGLSSRSRKHCIERRSVFRYRVIDPQAQIGWWSNGMFVRVPAQIVDLSTMGCRVETGEVLAHKPTQTIWLCALGRTPPEWTESVIVSVRKRFMGNCEVRLRFATPLAYESFKSLVYGPEGPEDSSDWVPPEHEQDHYWR